MFFSFLPIIQVLQCVFFSFISLYTIFYHIPGPTLVFLIFHDFTFSCLTPGPPVCISHLPGFSLFRATQQVKQCLYLIFHVFQFSHHDPGSRVCISHFSRFWLFLTVFQVIECLCLILQLLTFSRNNTGPTLCMYRFYVSHCFLPHSRSYSVCFSFSTIFIFLSILQVLQCAFLIFPVFECFSTI